MSGKVIPLREPEPASPESPGPWVLGEVFTRDGVAYELVTVGEIKRVELGCGKGAAKKAPKTPRDVLDLLRDAGALVGDTVARRFSSASCRGITGSRARDWRNRERQAALDRTLVRSGRHEWILFNMLERLEGRREPAAESPRAPERN